MSRALAKLADCSCPPEICYAQLRCKLSPALTSGCSSLQHQAYAKLMRSTSVDTFNIILGCWTHVQVAGSSVQQTCWGWKIEKNRQHCCPAKIVVDLQVLIDQKESRFIRVTNQGSAPFSYEWNLGKELRLSVKPASGEVPPGQQALCCLAFAPRSEKHRMNSLAVSCRISSGKLYNLLLTGACHFAVLLQCCIDAAGPQQLVVRSRLKRN